MVSFKERTFGSNADAYIYIPKMLRRGVKLLTLKSLYEEGFK